MISAGGNDEQMQDFGGRFYHIGSQGCRLNIKSHEKSWRAGKLHKKQYSDGIT